MLMKYSEHVQDNLPIGSGVTEVACKTLVKQRLCGSGMRWKDTGIKVVLSLRALVQTPGRRSLIDRCRLIPVVPIEDITHPSQDRAFAPASATGQRRRGIPETAG